MSKNLHNIDKFFKDRIERFEDEPSSNVWNEIDKQLDKKQVVSISKSYYKLKLAAALLLLVSFGMAMYIFQMRKNNNELVEKNNIEIPLKTNTEVTKENVKALNQPDTANDSEKDKDNFLKKTPMSVDTSNQNEQFTENEDEEAIGILTEKSNKQSWKKIDLAEKVRRKIKFVNSEDKNEPIVKSIEKDKAAKIVNKTNKKQRPELAGSDGVNNKYIALIPLLFPTPQIQRQQLFTIPILNHEAIMPEAIPGNFSMIEDTKNIKKNNKKQNNKPSKYSKESSFSATVFFSPDIVGYDIKSDHPRFRDDDKDEIKKKEEPKFSSTFGILVGYKVNKNWALQSGATIFTRGTNINSKTIYARPDVDGNVNFRLSCFSGSSFIPSKSGNHPIDGDSTNASAKNSLQYIGIPLVLQYNISKGKLSIKPGIGVAFNFLLKNKIETVIDAASGKESASTNVQGLKLSYFNGSISVGADYSLNKKIALSFAPTARFALSTINKGEPVKTTLNSVGFATGLTYNF
jgi:hypothetical protein